MLGLGQIYLTLIQPLSKTIGLLIIELLINIKNQTLINDCHHVETVSGLRTGVYSFILMQWLRATPCKCTHSDLAGTLDFTGLQPLRLEKKAIT